MINLFDKVFSFFDVLVIAFISAILRGIVEHLVQRKGVSSNEI